MHQREFMIRVDDAEKWICNLENRIVEITEIKQKKEFLKTRLIKETSGQHKTY